MTIKENTDAYQIQCKNSKKFNKINEKMLQCFLEYNAVKLVDVLKTDYTANLAELKCWYSLYHNQFTAR